MAIIADSITLAYLCSCHQSLSSSTAAADCSSCYYSATGLASELSDWTRPTTMVTAATTIACQRLRLPCLLARILLASNPSDCTTNITVTVSWRSWAGIHPEASIIIASDFDSACSTWNCCYSSVACFADSTMAGSLLISALDYQSHSSVQELHT